MSLSSASVDHCFTFSPLETAAELILSLKDVQWD